MIKRYVEEMDTRQAQSSGIYQDFHWTVLRLLGEEEATVRVASQFRKTLENMPGQEPFIGVADFMRGVMSSEDAIKASGVQRSSLSAAHFIMAIDCVARGDREAAKRHLQVVIDTNCWHLYYHWWARAFLERLKSDPNWLPWFPPKVGHAAIDRQSTKDRDKIA